MDWSMGPLRSRVLDDLQAFARKQGAIFLRSDPDVMLGTGVPGDEDATEDKGGEAVLTDLKRRGWAFTSDQVQFRNTVWLDISVPEAEMLARMKQKTRYNVRLAQKKGVTVRVGTRADLPMLYKMYAETSVRNGFVIRDESYYRTVWETFLRPSDRSAPESAIPNQPSAESLIAEVDGAAVAAVFNFWFAGRAYYLYGMSLEIQRERMPNYLLQWEAMKHAQARGCQVYDLWGAPDKFQEDDPLWDVFRFKQGWGGRVVRTLGAWDYPVSPMWYGLYTRIIPRILDVMRARGNRRTQQTLE
jgi:peptidoglycan pentaglycine glycine transferase (the first glycine)